MRVGEQETLHVRLAGAVAPLVARLTDANARVQASAALAVGNLIANGMHASEQFGHTPLLPLL